MDFCVSAYLQFSGLQVLKALYQSCTEVNLSVITTAANFKAVLGIPAQVKTNLNCGWNKGPFCWMKVIFIIEWETSMIRLPISWFLETSMMIIMVLENIEDNLSNSMSYSRLYCFVFFHSKRKEINFMIRSTRWLVILKTSIFIHRYL